MANYLSGAPQDYIPQLQPFNPDLNYYSNILQTKQSQYDASYHQINQAYGTLLNAPMTRMENIDRRDKFFKTIDGDVKKIAKLDLSQEQNVHAAMNAFKPLYNDKDIVNDMVKTKQLHNQYQIADNYKNCIDPDKCGGSYWDTGKKALQYWENDFRNASREKALNMGVAEFTPYIDVADKMSKYAKDLNIDAVVEQSNGRWIIKQKNGSLIEKPLHNALMSKFGSDPKIMSMYKTQAYVDRKSAVQAMTQDYNSPEEAEAVYLTQRFAQLADKAVRRDGGMKEELAALDNKKKLKEQQAQNYGVNTSEDQLIKSYENIYKARQDAENASKITEQGANLVKSYLPEDNEGLALRVDELAAQDYLHDQVDVSAQNWAALHGEVTMQADPYGVAAANHQFRMIEQDAEHSFKAGESEKDRQFKWDFENAKYKRDHPIVDPNPTPTGGGAGAVSHQFSVKDSNDNKIREKNSQIVGMGQQYVQKTLDNFINVIKDGQDPLEITYAKNKFKEITGLDWDGEKKKNPDWSFDSDAFSKNSSASTYFKAKAVVEDYKKVNKIGSNGNVVVLGGKVVSATESPFISQIRDLEVGMSTAKAVKDAVQADQDYNDKVILTNLKTDPKLPDAVRGQLGNAFVNGKLTTESDFVKRALPKQMNKLYNNLLKEGNYSPQQAATIKAGLNKYVSDYIAGKTGRDPILGKALSDIKSTYGTIRDKYYEYEAADNGKLKHYSSNPAASSGTGGIVTKSTITTADLRNTQQEATQGILGMESDLKRGNVAKVIFGDASQVTDQTYGELQDNEIARTALQTFINKIKGNEFGTSKTNPVTDFKFVDMAANNPGMAAYEVTLPQEFLHNSAITGTKSTPGIGFGGIPDKITIFVPTDKTVNPIYEKLKTPETDIILKHKGAEGLQVNDYPNAGTFNIAIRDNGQGYKIHGTVNYVDANTGELKSKPIGFTETNPYVNSDVILNNLRQQFSILNKQNAEDLLSFYVNNKGNIKGTQALSVLKQGLEKAGITVNEE